MFSSRAFEDLMERKFLNVDICTFDPPPSNSKNLNMW